MPRTKAKPKVKPNPTTPVMNGTMGDVLTLAEAAAYLRLPEAEVGRLIYTQGLPGRAVGAEWRFLKTALQDWLRTPPAAGSKEAMLSVIGSEKDDPFRDDMRKEINRMRGRTVIEEGE